MPTLTGVAIPTDREKPSKDSSGQAKSMQAFIDATLARETDPKAAEAVRQSMARFLPREQPKPQALHPELSAICKRLNEMGVLSVEDHAENKSDNPVVILTNPGFVYVLVPWEDGRVKLHHLGRVKDLSQATRISRFDSAQRILTVESLEEGNGQFRIIKRGNLSVANKPVVVRDKAESEPVTKDVLGRIFLDIAKNKPVLFDAIASSVNQESITISPDNRWMAFSRKVKGLKNPTGHIYDITNSRLFFIPSAKKFSFTHSSTFVTSTPGSYSYSSLSKSEELCRVFMLGDSVDEINCEFLFNHNVVIREITIHEFNNDRLPPLLSAFSMDRKRPSYQIHPLSTEPHMREGIVCN